MISILKSISSLFRPYRNKKRQQYYAKKYGPVDNDFIILSNNCIGGMCYHDANKEFLSPTINLSIDNFLIFVSKYADYLACDLHEVKKENATYPVATLNPNNGLPPVTVKFVHYDNFDEAKSKWQARVKRMLNTNGRFCVIYCMPFNTILDKKTVDAFSKIKAYKKICFYREASTKIFAENDSVRFVEIPRKYHNIDITKYTGILSRKRYFDYFFDIYKFLFF